MPSPPPCGIVVKTAFQCRICKRCRFNSWVQNVLWRRKRQPTPVFLPGNSHGQKSLAGYIQPMELQRVWHDWAHTHSHFPAPIPRGTHTSKVTRLDSPHIPCEPVTLNHREERSSKWGVEKERSQNGGMVSYEGWGQVAQQVLSPSSLSCLTVFCSIASIKNFRQRNKDVESFALRVSWLIGWFSKAPTTLFSLRFTGSWLKFPKSFPFNSIPETHQILWSPFGFLWSAYFIFLGSPEES